MRSVLRAASVGMIAAGLVLSGTSSAAAAEVPVELGDAESYAVLAGSTVANTGSSVLEGDLGLSPGTAITGFPPGQVDGDTHVNDTEASNAKDDLVTAYDDAAGRTTTETIVADLGGQTLVPGVYAGGALAVTGTLTLDAGGDEDAVFVFKAASSLVTASSSSISLIGGADACNVFWQVTSSATLGTSSDFVGTILALTSITANTGASIEGRLLTRNAAVTLDINEVTVSACAAAAPSATSTTTTTVVGATTTSAVAGASPTTVADPSSPSSTDTAQGTPTTVGGLVDDTPTATADPSGSPSTLELPRTGDDTLVLGVLGAFTVLLGVALVRTSRRMTIS
jgi:LPXTG-motif cell wall-anchored protein